MSGERSKRGWAWRSLALLGLVTIAAVPALARPPAAAAHPLGNFTMNRYSRLEIYPEELRLRYVLDMAEIPAFTELDSMDEDRDGRVSDEEAAQYRERQAAALARGLRLYLNGAPLALQSISQEISFPEGQGGLRTLRLSADYLAPLRRPAGGEQMALDFRDENYANRLGWREVVVRAGAGVRLLNSSASAEDISDELRSYPNDLLKSPLNRHAAGVAFTIAPGASAVPEATVQQEAPRGGGPVSRAWAGTPFAALVTAQKHSLAFVLLALLLAMGYGALHSLGPGHGKTVVAAYLVGSRGTARHALLLGLTVTATHTSSVLTVGLLSLSAQRFIAPERAFVWLGIASGVLVVALGLGLLVARVRRVVRRHRHTCDHPGEQRHPREHADGPHRHEHQGRGHTHLPAGGDGSPVGLRALLALGVSGGLLPCPSALVVMLGAIALGRVGFGLLLIVAFSAGLAGTLTVIGLLFVYARSRLRAARVGERWGHLLPAARGLAAALPVASALAITGAGLAITVQALAQAGLLLGA